MPQSRRTRNVALTETAKKTRDHKTAVIQDVREAVDGHKRLYLFSYENMRSNKFKNIRMDFRGTKKGSNASSMSDDEDDGSDDDGKKENDSSRIFLGKNKLLQIALGRSSGDEYADNLREVSKRISGSVGLLMTNRSSDDVEKYFANLAEDDFARAGAVAPRKVVLTSDMIGTHPVSMVEQFRKLGLPVEVQNGRVGLVGGKTEHVVCKKGNTLSAEACKILVHFGVKLAKFRVALLCRWSDGEFELLSQ